MQVIKVERDDPEGMSAETADLWIVQVDDADVIFGPDTFEACGHYLDDFLREKLDSGKAVMKAGPLTFWVKDPSEVTAW